MPGRFETIAQSKIRAQEDGASSTAFRISSTWFLDYEKSPAHEACARIAKYSSIEAILAGLDAMSEWSGEKYLKHIEKRHLSFGAMEIEHIYGPKLRYYGKELKVLTFQLSQVALMQLILRSLKFLIK